MDPKENECEKVVMCSKLIPKKFCNASFNIDD